jgi:pyruvate kinase
MIATAKRLQDPLEPAALVQLRERLLALRQRAIELESHSEDEIALVHPDRKAGARNLVDYLAIRQIDIRDLQHALYAAGLSSLGVMQGHVMASIDAVTRVLDRLCSLDCGIADTANRPAIANGRQQLEDFADDTLGAGIEPGLIRIMVTMPSEAATDAAVIETLLEQGMTIMRVNCAHDGPEAWQTMINHLEAAKAKLRKECRIAFDLAGPKLRTGPIASGPEVLRLKPVRDPLGCTVAPASIYFGPAASFNEDEIGIIPIDALVHEQARVGDEVSLKDARGRDRKMHVVEVNAQSFLCTSDRTAYLTTGMSIDLLRGSDTIASGNIGKLPAIESSISLSPGDSLIVTRELASGRAALMDEEGEITLEPARIGCTLAAVFDSIAEGHRVLLDDGKFEGIVRDISPGEFRVEITRAGRGQATLKAEKGINLPDTPLDLPALTAKDIEDLDIVVQHGDLVSFSFVHRSQDIDELYAHLQWLGAGEIGVVLKIENRAAFAALPELLVTASKRKRVAVMVARGDLGVEIGFERLAEVQEEMLWLCEAAQVPVIWATQVLESLAKNGLPSRGEVTDAAMSTRAECVMLNKGPYIAEAIRFLTDVSRRMSEHSSKTFATHRALSVAGATWLAADHSEAP